MTRWIGVRRVRGCVMRVYHNIENIFLILWAIASHEVKDNALRPFIEFANAIEKVINNAFVELDTWGQMLR